MDEADRPEKLARRTDEYEKLRGEVVAAQTAIDDSWTDHRAKSNEEAKPMKDLRHRSGLLHKEARKETPGKPAVPRRPSPPKEPTGSGKGKDKDDDPSPSEVRRYNEDLRDYEEDLRDYERDVANYPQRLAEWKKADQARRQEIKTQQTVVDAGIQDRREARHTPGSDWRATPRSGETRACRRRPVD